VDACFAAFLLPSLESEAAAEGEESSVSEDEEA